MPRTAEDELLLLWCQLAVREGLNEVDVRPKRIRVAVSKPVCTNKTQSDGETDKFQQGWRELTVEVPFPVGAVGQDGTIAALGKPLQPVRGKKTP